jgi:hypothetical protein
MATVPFKVVSKSDSMSATIPTPEGRRKTVTELLGTSLNKVELDEIQTTKMLISLCKSMSLSLLSLCSFLLVVNGVYDYAKVNDSLTRADLGELVQRLCQEFRQVARAQRPHRLLCEVAGLMDDELELLSKVHTHSFVHLFPAFVLLLFI